MDKIYPSGGANPDYPGLIYAGLLVLGGLMGFLKKGSKMSLLGGLIAAGLQFYGSQKVTVDNMDVMFALWTNAALCTYFTYKFAKSEKFFPAGMSIGMADYSVSMLSLVLICRYAIMIA